MVATEEFIELCAFEPYWRISELIAERIDVNAKGEYGWTALMYDEKILQVSYGDTYDFSEGDSVFSLSILYDKEGYVLEIYFIGKFINESDFISALSACSVEMSEWENIGDKFRIVFFLIDENSETFKWIGHYNGRPISSRR